MTELAEPQLDTGERFILRLLTKLEGEFGDPEDLGDEKVQFAKSLLAISYVEHTKVDVAWKSGLMLLAYDWLFHLDSMVYGLSLASLGSIALGMTQLYTPNLLAEEGFTEADTPRAKIESKARLSVKTNAGVAGLLLGFILQIFAISGPIPSELVKNNILHGVIPTWAGFFLVLFCGYLLFGKVVPATKERIF